MKSEIDYQLLSTIVRSLRTGDESAASAFYELTHLSVFKFCYYLCLDEANAHDLCHDTYVKALMHLDSLKDERTTLAWLFKIARNTFLDHQKKKTEELTDKAEEIPVENIPEDVISIKEALASFSQDDKMILLLVDLAGLSYQEAAISMNATENAIRMKLHKLRAQFIKNFEG